MVKYVRKKKDVVFHRQAWITLLTFSLMLLMFELFINLHGKFVVESIPGFYAWFGFISCALIVLLSKTLGVILKKPLSVYSKKRRSQ